MIEDTPTGEVPEPKIEIVEVREVDPIPRDVPDQAVAQRIGDPEDGGELEVYIRQSALAGMTEHVKSNVKQEIGGILVGNYCVDEKSKRFWVDIIGFIPAKHTEAGGAHLRFTLETWADLDDELDARFKDQEHVSVGWYHSHPNLSVFFSPADESVHKHFASWWQVAIVIDPIREEIAFFRESRKTRGRFHRLAGVFVYKDGEQDQPPTLKYDPVDRFGVEDEMPIVSSGGESPAAKSGKGALTINVLERTGLGANKLWIAIITVAALAVGLLAFALTRNKAQRGPAKASRLETWVKQLYAADTIDDATNERMTKNLGGSDDSEDPNGRLASVERDARAAVAKALGTARAALADWDATYTSIGPVQSDHPARLMWESEWRRLSKSVPTGTDQGVDAELLSTDLAEEFKKLGNVRIMPRIRAEFTDSSRPLNAVQVRVAGVVDESVGRSNVTINGRTVEYKDGRFDQLVDLPTGDGPFDIVIRADGGSGPAERPLHYVVDRTPPRISIDGGESGAKLIDQPPFVITGHVEEEFGLVRLTGPNGLITPNARGEFRFAGELPIEGTKPFRFEAEDRAGNTSRAVISVTFKSLWREPLENAIKAGASKEFERARDLLAHARSLKIPVEEAPRVSALQDVLDRWFALPSLVVESPVDGEPIHSDKFTISGQVNTRRPEDRVRINDATVSIEGGRFTYTYVRRGAETDVKLTLVVLDEREAVRGAAVERHVTFVDPALFKSPSVAGGPYDPNGLAGKYSVPPFVENAFGMKFHLLRATPAANGAKQTVTYLQVTEMSRSDFAKARGKDVPATDGSLPQVGMTLDAITASIEDLKAARNGDQPRIAYRLPRNDEWTLAADIASGFATGADWPKVAATMNLADKSAAPKASADAVPKIPTPSDPAAPAAGTPQGRGAAGPAVPAARYFPDDDGHSGVAPIGSYKRNRLGFYDLIGNVWEWTLAPAAGAEGQSPSAAAIYQLRGGSFQSGPDVAPSFMKDAGNGEAADDVGFRLAFDIDVEQVKNLPEARK